jgi:catechol 2,3-dioxygenase-like lactoylglutathione lyase family enzyme
MEHMDCTDFGRANACAAGDTQIIFFERDVDGPSVGTGADHIGFSFRDLDAKMRSYEAAGVKILNPIRDVDGLFKLAFVEDPWGTKIEVVEDHEWLGFHHLHLRSSDPESALAWYENIFGGERDSLKGRIAGLRYGTVWLLVSRHEEGELAATQGRAIDHLGWQFPDLRAAAEEIKGKGVEFQLEPRPFTNPLGQDMLISFVVGPDGVRIEIVQPQA